MSQPDSKAPDLNARQSPMNVVAHELQNPLGAIRGYADLVKNLGPLSEKQLYFLGRIIESVDDMSELIGQLLDAAWVDSGVSPRLGPVNLAHLAKNIGESYHPWAKKQGIALEYHLDRTPPVLAEERRIKQVLHNLISNAIKYSRPGGKVELFLQAVEGQARFEVRDQGVGIPEEYLPRLFERFFRIPHPDGHQIEGNGLGLSISKEILERHGQTLHVESQAELGTCFYFNLPFQPD
jgi:signal transduction histidine kinase